MTRVTRDTNLEVERSKVKITRPYPGNGKAYELCTWYTDGVRWPASPTCAATTKLNALGGCSSHHLHGAGAYCGAPLQVVQLV